MLCWEIFIQRRPTEETIAIFMAPLDLPWLRDLLSKELAKDLGGNGYPDRYEIAAGALLALYDKGVLTCDGPVIKSDNYWKEVGGKTQRVNLDQLRSLDPAEILDVEAWDQS